MYEEFEKCSCVVWWDKCLKSPQKTRSSFKYREVRKKQCGILVLYQADLHLSVEFSRL